MSEYDYQSNGMNQEIGWGDTIEHDSEFVIVPEGDYSFTVTKFERARHNGSDKLPPCNKAVLTLEVSDGVNSTLITHNLFLHRKTEGMLCAFFTAIGQRKHGEKLIPKWDQVVGATGTCKVGKRSWTGNDGSVRESNEIRRFYEKNTPAAPQQPQQAYQQQAMYGNPQGGYQPQSGGYKPGQF